MDIIEVARMGGKARAKKLSKQQRSEAARAAVNARWDQRRRLLAASKRKGRKAAA